MASAIMAPAGDAAFDPSRMRPDGQLPLRWAWPDADPLAVIDVGEGAAPTIYVAEGSGWARLERRGITRDWVTTLRVRTGTDPLPAPSGRPTLVGDQHALGDVDGDGMLEVVTARSDGPLVIRDAATGALEASRLLSYRAHNQAIAVADIEGGPEAEIILLGEAGLSVRRADEATPVWLLPDVVGAGNAAGRFDELLVGEVDGAPGLEIIVSLPTEATIVDVATRAVEWFYSTGFGEFVGLADVDGDGLDEPFGCDDACTVVDGDRRLEKWQVAFDADAVTAADVDGDGLPEVILSGSGRAWALDGETGDTVLETFFTGGGRTVGAMKVADFDGDCFPELLHTDIIRALEMRDLISGRRDWEPGESTFVGGPVAAVDRNGDGRLEAAWLEAARRAPTEPVSVFLTLSDMGSGTLRHFAWDSLQDGGYFHGPLAHDIDGDGRTEVIVAGVDVVALDSLSGEVRWRSPPLAGETAASLTLGDVTGDAVPEVLLGTAAPSTGDGFVHVLSVMDGSPIFPARRMGFGPVLLVSAGDIEGTGSRILAVLSGESPHLLDPATGVLRWSGGPRTTALTVADLMPGGPLEIVLADLQGDLRVLDGRSRSELATTTLGDEPVRGVAVQDLDGDGAAEVLALHCANDRCSIGRLAVLPADLGEVLWEHLHAASEAEVVAFSFADVDGDGTRELSFGARFYEHARAVEDTSPPALAGPLLSRQASSCCPSIALDWEPATDEASPPVTYEVHRGPDGTFLPDETTLIARTPYPHHLDRDSRWGETYWHAVVARDAAGNASASPIRASATPVDGTPPPAPVLLEVRDRERCERDGLEVVFDPPRAVGLLRYEILRDGEVIEEDATSPHLDMPRDGELHAYTVRAREPNCDVATDSDTSLARDAGGGLARPTVLEVRDRNPCTADGVEVHFEGSSSLDAQRHDLLRDGVVIATDVSSPVTVTGTGSRRYVVRAVDTTCGRESDSFPRFGEDEAAGARRARDLVVTDLDTCTASPAVVHFEHPGFHAGGHHELWRDGAPFLSPIVSGQVFSALDGDLHEYTVMSHEYACDASNASDPFLHADERDCTGQIADTTIRCSVTPDAELVLAWEPPWGDPGRFDLHVGTLASLRSTGTYDHAPTAPGVRFPGAPDEASGCAVGEADATSARVEGLPRDAYLILVPVSSTGVQAPWGRDSRGIARQDPAVDPRPVLTFCP